MSYLGGKSTGAAHILRAINHPSFAGCTYIEPFVGMGHILRRVVNKAEYWASDVHPLLIELLQRVQCGCELPWPITKAQYYELKRDATGERIERAVACFLYSYNGKAWGGYTAVYTRKSGRVDDIAGSRRRYLMVKLAQSDAFRQAHISCLDYHAAVTAHTHERTVIYCDPPYRGTAGYRGTPSFDTDEFWESVRSWSRGGSVVFVSEYAAPSDFVSIASAAKASCVGDGHRQTARTERLFVHESLLPEMPPDLIQREDSSG
jgi:DNA adenine methylase